MAISSQTDLEKMKTRQSYRNMWHTDLTRAILADGAYFCFALWCGPCASFMLRKRALHNDMSRYECCAGHLPCSGHCRESECPELCLCTEVVCCFGNSVAWTRFLLQDELDIQTTKCDNCIIVFVAWLHELACLFSIIAMITGNSQVSKISQYLSLAAQVAFCGVCACMQTQHKIEMDKRDGKLGGSIMLAPPIMQISRLDRPIPPSAGRSPATFENPFAL